ncbi:MAG: IclR family transcriptional regulator [Bryobacteraceae bacterium]|nr:IclR family transcriptional regulator [Bryobacteraceae bacterium]
MKRALTNDTAAVDRYESRSLAKGLRILDTLAAASAPMQLKDLAESAGLGKASTLRLLRTLQSTGYLVRDQNDCYRLDREWPHPQQHLLTLLRESAAPLLRALNSEFGETVALAFLFDDLIRVIEVIESTQQIRMSNYKGGLLQPHASSLGKAIAAFQTPEKAQKLLSTYGNFKLAPATLTDPRAIQEEYAAIRERGFAFDLEETVPGGNCVGAPIRSVTGEVVGALSISMPKDRFTAELHELLPARLKQCAEQVTNAMKQASQPPRESTKRTSRSAKTPVA